MPLGAFKLNALAKAIGVAISTGQFDFSNANQSAHLITIGIL